MELKKRYLVCFGFLICMVASVYIIPRYDTLLRVHFSKPNFDNLIISLIAYVVLVGVSESQITKRLREIDGKIKEINKPSKEVFQGLIDKARELTNESIDEIAKDKPPDYNNEDIRKLFEEEQEYITRIENLSTSMNNRILQLIVELYGLKKKNKGDLFYFVCLTTSIFAMLISTIYNSTEVGGSLLFPLVILNLLYIPTAFILSYSFVLVESYYFYRDNIDFVIDSQKEFDRIDKVSKGREGYMKLIGLYPIERIERIEKDNPKKITAVC